MVWLASIPVLLRQTYRGIECVYFKLKLGGITMELKATLFLNVVVIAGIVGFMIDAASI